MTQTRAAVVLGASLALAVGTCVVLLLLGVHWLVFGPIVGLITGLAVGAVLQRPRTEPPDRHGSGAQQGG